MANYFFGFHLQNHDLGESIRQQAHYFKSPIEDFQWTLPPNYHLTVFYIGKLEPPEVGLVKEGVRDLVGKQTSFMQKVVDYTIFKTRRKGAAVLILDDLEQEMTEFNKQLSQSVSSILQKDGLANKEGDRQFTPHVTLGRLGTKASRETVNDVLQTVHKKIDNHRVFEFKTLSLMHFNPEQRLYVEDECYTLLD